LLPEYGGTKVFVNEEELLVFKETDIIGSFDGKVEN
jgi:co-chaperonin GroES (HSP10)